MGMKQFIVHDTFISYKRLRLQEGVETIKLAKCKPDNLRHKRNLSLSDISNSREIDCMWFESDNEIKQFNIPDGTGGVNPGDRRSIYY